jgi:hypothetical protein
MDSTDALARDLIPFLGNIAQMLDETRVERDAGHGLNWTPWCQEQRDTLTALLRRANTLTKEDNEGLIAGEPCLALYSEEDRHMVTLAFETRGEAERAFDLLESMCVPNLAAALTKARAAS